MAFFVHLKALIVISIVFAVYSIKPSKNEVKVLEDHSLFSTLLEKIEGGNVQTVNNSVSKSAARGFRQLIGRRGFTGQELEELEEVDDEPEEEEEEEDIKEDLAGDEEALKRAVESILTTNKPEPEIETEEVPLLSYYDSLDYGLAQEEESLSMVVHRRCTTTAECKARYDNPDLECRAGACQERRCTSNLECHLGAACIGGACVDVALGSEKHCSSPGNRCPPHHTCYVPRWLCMVDGCGDHSECPGDTRCLDGVCSGAPCKGDDDCAYGWNCLANHCQKPAKATLDNDEERLDIEKLTGRKISPYRAQLKPGPCRSHGDCSKAFEMCNMANNKCQRIICSVSKDCPGEAKCHQDLVSKYCQEFICTKDEDCTQRRCQRRDGLCPQTTLCSDGTCILRDRCDENEQCKGDSLCVVGIKNTQKAILSMTGVCAKVPCVADANCPDAARCDTKRKHCKNFSCKSNLNCGNGEKCQHRKCVSRVGGQCQKHLQCPALEVCNTRSGQCTSVKCERDRDCVGFAERNRGAGQVWCHPQGYCSGSEEAVEGMQIARAANAFRSSAILKSPKHLKQRMPVSDKEIKTAASEEEKSVRLEFPSYDQAFKEALKRANNLETISLGQFCDGEEGAKNDSNACEIHHKDKGHLRRKRQAPPQKRRWRNGRRRRNGSRQGRIAGTKNRREADPQQLFLHGQVEFAAAGVEGDVISTVGERLARRLGLNRGQAAIGLGRKKLKNCYWKNETTLRINHEFVRGCNVNRFLQLYNVNPRLYRTNTGACNNLSPRRQHWGMTGLPFDRVIKADFDNGIASFRRSKVDGSPLPNPRRVSLALNGVLSSVTGSHRKRPDPNVNSFFVFFGQFVDHDLSNSLAKSVSQSTPIFGEFLNPSQPRASTCCGPPKGDFANTWVAGDENSRKTCIPFRVPPRDPYWRVRGKGFKSGCVHQLSVQGFPKFDCNLGPRQVLNQINQWLDLSQVYNAVRRFMVQINRQNSTTSKGRLSSSANDHLPSCPTTRVGPNFPPNSCPSCLNSVNRFPLVGQNLNAARGNCLIGGDFRTNENVLLGAIQTLFFREHNLIADALAKARPQWSNDVVFEEARRINTAQYQHIIYNEFLPKLIGRQAMRKFRLFPLRNAYRPQYNPDLDPGLSNIFASAAFRFGHGMIPDFTFLLKDGKNQLEPKPLKPNDLVFSWPNFRQGTFMRDLVRGSIASAAGRVDGMFAREAREIFNVDPPSKASKSNVGGFDLLAWNINRGRDHGIPGYTLVQKLVLKTPIDKWSDLNDRIMWAPKIIPKLKQLYKSPRDLDLYMMALLEKPPAKGGRRTQAVGPTYAAIIGSQFARLRRADRFFYEHSADKATRFRPIELVEIKKVTMARILCNNLGKKGDQDKMVRDPFRLHTAANVNNAIPCTRIPKVNWNIFAKAGAKRRVEALQQNRRRRAGKGAKRG